MRYSNDLNIIIKAIQKATNHIPRDFVEIENLQSNPISAAKFTASCLRRVKDILIDDLSKFRQNYNMVFPDNQNIIHSDNAEYSYAIIPIDGFSNLKRSNPDFTVAIALEHLDKSEKKEAIAVVIYRVISGELYYCDKGYGAYLNNRRIRVVKRSGSFEELLIASDDQKLLAEKMLGKNFSSRSYGSRSMEIAYFASSRLDCVLFKNQDQKFLKPFFLLAREAGGIIKEEENYFMINSN